MPFVVRSSFAVSAPLLVALVAACADDGGDASWGTGGDDQMPNDPPGELEYETPDSAFYRLERRVDIVALDGVSRAGCGLLTDRAYDDLVTTLDSLDPTEDYNVWMGCLQSRDPRGRVHLEGFEHSPFACDWDCCHPDLGDIALVYFMVGNNLYDQTPVYEGEPYVALDPDRACG
jgi:hypothetical protein